MVAHIQPIRTRIYRPQTNLLCRPIENGLHLEQSPTIGLITIDFRDFGRKEEVLRKTVRERHCGAG